MESSRHILDGRYIAAHCLRFSMQNSGDFQKAKNYLEKNISACQNAHGGDPELEWRRWRDEMELGSLLVAAATIQRLSVMTTAQAIIGKTGMNFFDDDESLSIFQDGVAYLQSGFNAMIESIDKFKLEGLPNTCRDRLYNRLTMLGATNLIGAFIFERILLGLQSTMATVSSDIAEDYIYALEREISICSKYEEKILFTQHIYLYRAKSLISRSAKDRRIHLNHLSGYLERFKNGSYHTMIDKLEFNYIHDQLMDEKY